MINTNFFEEQKEQSLVKTTIVTKYFDVWASVIINTQKRYPEKPQKIAYIDLFAGPGRFKDGSQSTPLRVLTNAIAKPDLRERLVTIFNDKNSDNSCDLENAISLLPGIEMLKHEPSVYNQEVGEEIVKLFEKMTLIPTLFFVDPWGYKGLSLRLVNSVLKDWGCDAIFFFNYNRINMGLNNVSVIEHMKALFGEKQMMILKNKLECKNPNERELLIVEELCLALKAFGSRFVLPFRFRNSSGQRTSHHLIFVSKHVKGYELMKEIMARESSGDTQGVPSFEYNPADKMPEQTFLYQLYRPLNELKEQLLFSFNGQRLTMRQIYEIHNVDTSYVKKNYKDVLCELYDESSIEAVSPTGKAPRKGTFGDDIIVTFPNIDV